MKQEVTPDYWPDRLHSVETDLLHARRSNQPTKHLDIEALVKYRDWLRHRAKRTGRAKLCSTS